MEKKTESKKNSLKEQGRRYAPLSEKELRELRKAILISRMLGQIKDD